VDVEDVQSTLQMAVHFVKRDVSSVAGGAALALMVGGCGRWPGAPAFEAGWMPLYQHWLQQH